ncbi:hypothetical protein OROMI_001107 [Orobanche minor]
MGHQLLQTDKLEPLGEAREILKFARVQTRKRAPNLMHPLVGIDVIEEGIVSGARAGLWKEATAFQSLLESDTCKSMVHFFFAQRGTTKVPGVSDLRLKPRSVKKVAILGGGLMGSGIATALILANYEVILKEVNDKFLQSGIDRVKANLKSRIKKGQMSQEKFEKTLTLLKGALDYESFRDVDMVIEAVIENVSLKQKIFSDLEKFCPPHYILASNTSTIDLNLIGEKTRSHDRIIGAHFFSPAHVMPFLEIVRTPKTSPQVIVDLLDVGKKIRKTPVVVGNCTGFAVNRMFFPYTQAALLLVERGTDIYQIDKAITKFGMPMGPFRLCDLSMLIPLMQEDKRAGDLSSDDLSSDDFSVILFGINCPKLVLHGSFAKQLMRVHILRSHATSNATNENLPPNVIKQLAKELKNLDETPPEGIKVGVNDDDNFSAPGTPYENGVFRMKLILSQDFPHKGYFLTKIFHPNIASNGEICVNALKRDWNPTLGLRHHVLIVIIRCLLIEPFPESALNEQAGKMMLLENYDEYARHAFHWNTCSEAEAKTALNVDQTCADQKAAITGGAPPLPENGQEDQSVSSYAVIG